MHSAFINMNTLLKGRRTNINTKHCNFRCMEDSRRQASLSRFLQRQSNIIRFSVDAFLLPQVTGTVMFSFLNVSYKRENGASCHIFNYRNYWVRLGLKLGLQNVLTAHNLRNILFLDGILNLSIIIALGEKEKKTIKGTCCLLTLRIIISRIFI